MGQLFIMSETRSILHETVKLISIINGTKFEK